MKMTVKVFESEKAARNAVAYTVEKAYVAGRWMVAAWCVEDGMIRMVGVGTWNFPVGDFEMAQRRLKSYCDDEIKRLAEPSEPKPLKMADWVKAIRPSEDGDGKDNDDKAVSEDDSPPPAENPEPG